MREKKQCFASKNNMLLASYLAASSSLARRGRGTPVSFRSFAAASILAGGNSKGGGSTKKHQQKQSSSLPPPLPLPVVVLLGRPNVGKSALFNRLTGSRQALVRDTPGSHVTRDWRSSQAGKLGDLRFEVVDTSGLEEPRGGGGGGRGGGSGSSSSSSSSGRSSSSSSGPFLLEDGGLGSRAAALTACLLRARADVALLLLDARDGVTPVDEALARWLRRSGAVAVPLDDSSTVSSSSVPSPSDLLARSPASIVVAVNKAEAARSNPRVAAAVAEAGVLGFGEGVGISAETGEGLAELYAALAPTLDKAAGRLLLLQGLEERGEEEEEEEGGRGETGARRKGGGPMRVAIVGAPNAGKSTLSNALLGSERSLTGPEPGLTRDAVWATLEWTPPRERREEKVEEGDGEEEEASSPSSSPRRSSPRPRPRIVELIDTAGWDKRTARAASINRRNDGDDDDDQGGKETKASAATTAAGAGSSSPSLSSPSPASTLLAPADVIAEAMRQTERGINLAHVAVVVVDLAAAAARANCSPSSSSASAAPGLATTRATRARRDDDDGAAPQILSRTELALASRAAEAGRAVVFVGAKADLLLPPGNSGRSYSLERSPDVAAAARALALDVSRRLPQLAGAPVLALSAVTGAGLERLLPAVARAHAAWDGRVPTSALNKWLEGAKAASGAGGRGGAAAAGGGGSRDAAARSLSRVRYLTQASSRPPSFVAFSRGGTSRGSGGGAGRGGGGGPSSSSKVEAAKRAVARVADERLEKMLSNKIRAEFGLRGVPIRVAVRGPSPSSGGGGKTDFRRRS